jgi:hypothetical protein
LLAWGGGGRKVWGESGLWQELIMITMMVMDEATGSVEGMEAVVHEHDYVESMRDVVCSLVDTRRSVLLHCVR